MANILMRYGPNSTAIKAVEVDGEWALEVLGVPFGSQDRKDFDGQWFTEKTDIMMQPGDKRPALYYHGMAPNGERVKNPEVIGVSEYARTDEQGHWFRVVLDQTKKLAKRIWNAARRGLTYASSGAIAHLFRGNDKGEIRVWPIGEISLIDVGHGRAPSNWDAVALPMKSVFTDAGLEMPESFVEGDEPEGDEPKTDEVADELTPEQIISEEIEIARAVISAASTAAAKAAG